jgi:hypothetical protein
VFFFLFSRWIGFSLIAIFEILELMYQLVRRSCTKKQQQRIGVQPAVKTAVLELTSKSAWTKTVLEDTQSIDEIVLAK